MRRARVPEAARPAAAAVVAALISVGACPRDRAPDPLNLISVQERALARQAFSLAVATTPPATTPAVGGTGLDFEPLLREAGQWALYRRGVDGASSDQLRALSHAWADGAHLYALLALLDHTDFQVRLTALRAAVSLRDLRAVPAIIAAAKHNAFDPPRGDAGAEALIYRRQLADALRILIGVGLYEEAVAEAGHPGRQRRAFDFGGLDQWLERRVLQAQTWSRAGGDRL